MGDVHAWLGLPNGHYHPHPPPPPPPPPQPANPHPSQVAADSWQRAEEATEELIQHIQPTALSEQRRRAVVEYVQRLIKRLLRTEERELAGTSPSPPTMSLLLLQCSVIPPQSPPTTKTHHNRAHRQPQSHHLSAAHHLLDEIPHSDTFAWNSILAAHLTDHNPLHALLVYRHMLLHDARPDRHTLPRVLAASRLSSSTSTGLQAHAHALKLNLSSDPYVLTSLMELYTHFNGAHVADTVFRQSDCTNRVAWTLLAKLYVAGHNPAKALEVFDQMVAAGVELDSVALVTALQACRQLKSVKQSRKVLATARRRGLELDGLVANSLLKMFIECERVEEAQALFDWMPSKDAVSWTTMICGYVRNGGFNEGLKLFRAMCAERLVLDAFAVSTILPACARPTARKHGKEIHGCIVKLDIPMQLPVQNALMDMYMKSGNIEAAIQIFEGMVEKDTISWTVMILGCSLHGQGERGVALFFEMEERGRVSPDRAAYAAALHGCCTVTMAEEGRTIFERLSKPDIVHYALMVRLLSCAGRFQEAQEFVENHLIGSHPVVLKAMLDGCRIHRNVSLGKRIAEQLIELEPLNAENYVLLSNFYAANVKWDMVTELRETIWDMGLKPKRAYSWIEVRNKVHVFAVGDVSHPRSERIYWEIRNLRRRMEEEGNLPEEDFILHDVDEERECIPYGHSELLAIAFGLISTQETTTLHVTKNLRVCRSCHASAKMISKFVGRDIVLKDPECFHHFTDGCCSCRDIW